MKHTFWTAGFFALLAVFGTAQAAGDPSEGKAKADACAGCHGASGEGKDPYPALAGMPEDKIVQAMKDYKSGKRKNAIMKTFASKLGDQDTANVAAYYASLKGK